jgi:hypothetical protein
MDEEIKKVVKYLRNSYIKKWLILVLWIRIMKNEFGKYDNTFKW